MSQVYLWNILRNTLSKSRVYLRHILGVPQVHLLGISWAYPGHILGITNSSGIFLGISQTFIKRNSGIYPAYLRHFSGLSKKYIWHIYGKSQAYL